MTQYPISSVSSVFIPVKDLKSSIEWWSTLLNLPITPTNGGPIYVMPVSGTGLILDPNQFGFPHLVMYDTSDIDAAYRFAKERNFDIFYDLQRHPNVAYFNVFDAGKNNGIMICQGERTSPVSRQLSDECPIKGEITRVFAHTNDVTASARWYSDMLSIPLDDNRFTEDGYRLVLPQGRALYLLDHRHNPIGPVSYEKLGGANVRTYPMFELGTSNIVRAREWIEERGGVILPQVNAGQANPALYFQDPDGNVNIVSELE